VVELYKTLMSYIFSLGSQVCRGIERPIIQLKRYSYAIKQKLFDRTNVLMVDSRVKKKRKPVKLNFALIAHPLSSPISYVVETSTCDAT